MKSIVVFFAFACIISIGCNKNKEDKKDYSECPYKFEGGYSGRFENNNGFGTPVQLAVLSFAGDDSRLMFICNYFYYADTIRVDLNCNLGSFTIPTQQTNKDCYVSGYGTFSDEDSKLTLYYSDNCNFSLRGEFIKTKESGFAFYNDFSTYNIPIGRSATKNIHVKKYGDFDKTVSLKFESSDPEIYAIFGNEQGKPDFISTLTVTGPAVISDYYGVKISVKAYNGIDTLTDEGYVRYYNPNCISYFTGTLSVEEYCGNNYRSYTSSITQQSETRLFIQGFNNGVDNIFIEVDCENKKVSVPEQAISSGIISGSGSFYESFNYNTNQMEYEYLNIDYKITNGSTVSNCEVRINK